MTAPVYLAHLEPELLNARPVYDGAPRPLTPREAATLARREYAYRAGRGATWLLLSMGADGGLHYRDTAYSEPAARGWCEEKARALTRRLLAGECTHTCFYDRARDVYYLA